jgi:HK97 family phage major capsid protein
LGGMDSEFEDLSDENDVIERPYGTKPYGTKPYGTKPYGTKPYGTKPYGTKPYGTKPYGTKPYGTKPYGTKPYPAEDALDPELWSGDVAELICGCSAVIRLGATIVAGDLELEVPAIAATASYIAPKRGRAAERQQIGEIQLRPLDHLLDALVAVPNRLIPGIAGNAELADALKVDLADALTLAADTAFLEGSGRVQPRGISKSVTKEDPGHDLLASARALVESVRQRAVFRNPGWIINPLALNELTRLTTADGLIGCSGSGRSLDTFALLKLDGSDGGTLLGYPFVMSAAASAGKAARLYFSADWQEAWVAIGQELVTVDISAEAAFAANETLIRGSMFHDFALRRRKAFAWVEQEPKPEQKQEQKPEQEQEEEQRPKPEQ